MKSYQDQRQDSFGGRTPAYGNEGGRTVNPYFEGGGRTVNPYADGGRTAYGGGNVCFADTFSSNPAMIVKLTCYRKPQRMFYADAVSLGL